MTDKAKLSQHQAVLSMKKLGTITKQYGIGKLAAPNSQAWSILNIKATNKENSKIIDKWKLINNSTEKIGPKIISKYSMSKYQSNFDDVLDDPMEISDTLKFTDDSDNKIIDSAYLKQTLWSTWVKWTEIEDVMSIPWKINREKELENDKLKYATLRNKNEKSVSPLAFKNQYAKYAQFNLEKNEN